VHYLIISYCSKGRSFEEFKFKTDNISGIVGNLSHILMWQLSSMTERGGENMVYKVYMIENYVLRYDRKKERPGIIFHYKLDGQWKNVNWYPPAENAVFIAD
jgi:hypothetical protein